MTEQALNVRIDFQAMLEVMRVGARRASSFMALGLRSANDQTITSLNPPTSFQWRYLPNDLTDEQIREAQVEYGRWVIGSALTELHQHFERFLMSAYEARLYVEFSGQHFDADAERRRRQFAHDTNVRSRLQRIREQFGIATTFEEFASGLSQARNVLSHGLGRVSERHCDGAPNLMIGWLGLDAVVGDKTWDGSPLYVEKDSIVSIVCNRREKIIPIGEKIALSAHELSEICWNYLKAAEEIAKAISEEMQRRGLIRE